jgi:hypothetical protein
MVAERKPFGEFVRLRIGKFDRGHTDILAGMEEMF